MSQYKLYVSGWSCMGCVNKTHKALLEHDHQLELAAAEDKQSAVLTTHLAPQQTIAIIEEVGYRASLCHQDNQHHQFDTQNVNCGGCAKKLTNAILKDDPSAKVTVNVADKTVTIESSLNRAQLSARLNDLNYLATSSAVETVKEGVPNQDPTTSLSDSDSQAQKSEQPNTKSYLRYNLSGVTCASCVRTIENALNKVEGVEDVAINFGNRTATVYTELDSARIKQVIEKAGYGASPIVDEAKSAELREQAIQDEYKDKLRNAALGTGLGLILMASMFVDGSMELVSTSSRILWFLVGLVTLAIMWIAGKHFFTGAISALQNRTSNMDTLIALGTSSAWLYSMFVVLFPELVPANSRHLYFEASAMIIGLINLGQALEVKARGRTSKAINRLLDLQAKTAMVLDAKGEPQLTPIDDVQVSDQILIRNGERIPVDGIVLNGNTNIDESMLTGEPIAVIKSTGDNVSAGTVNGDHSITIEATKIGRDTLLAHIVDMVSKAQNSKPPISQLADKVSAIFVPIVIVIAIVTAVAWALFGPQPVLVNTLVAATSVLIIACPCALGLATPISTMIGIGKAAEVGGLIRTGDALQKASEIDVVVMDKTGTITQGKPSVTHHYLHASELATPEQILTLVYQMEIGSSHPLADSLKSFSYSAHEATTNLTLSNIQAVAGLGLTAHWNEHRISLGNQTLMAQVGVDSTKGHCFANHPSDTHVYLAINNQFVAEFAISDPIKFDSKQAIAQLQALGVKVVMLTGDTPEVAKAVAAQVNIDEYHASLMPSDKLDWVKRLQQQELVVGMVGDGINDAPALAQSDVGFAIGQGTDVAIESADITLMRGSLNGISHTIAISKATLGNIKQNLWGAFIYNSLGIPIAAGLLYPITGMLLNPIVAGIAMSLSSITVVSNANRLRLFNPNSRSGTK
jgi:Cu+-exporting ATPase